MVGVAFAVVMMSLTLPIPLQAIMDFDRTTTFADFLGAGLSTCITCDDLAGPTNQVDFHLSMHKRYTFSCIPSQNVVPARQNIILYTYDI